jgi:beta-glucosidase-like glycosyl hydrolase
MQAAKSAGSPERRAQACLDAGCDLVLACDPDEAVALLADLGDQTPCDATGAIERLYGRPTVDREDLAAVARERIGEWRRWRESLEELGNQTWT